MGEGTSEAFHWTTSLLFPFSEDGSPGASGRPFLHHCLHSFRGADPPPGMGTELRPGQSGHSISPATVMYLRWIYDTSQTSETQT